MQVIVRLMAVQNASTVRLSADAGCAIGRGYLGSWGCAERCYQQGKNTKMNEKERY